MLPSLRPVATAFALVAAVLLLFQGWTASAQTAKPAGQEGRREHAARPPPHPCRQGSRAAR